jgi:hypothetical protein
MSKNIKKRKLKNISFGINLPIKVVSTYFFFVRYPLKDLQARPVVQRDKRSNPPAPPPPQKKETLSFFPFLEELPTSGTRLV